MIEAPPIARRYQEESTRFKYASHFSQGLFRGMEVRHHANGEDKAEGAFRKREAMCVSQAGENGGAHSSTSRISPRGIQHFGDGVHRLDTITTLSQRHDAQSGSASDFENLSPERYRQLISPSQHDRQTLSVNRALNADFLVHLSPPRHV
jgi:hypothetical protein